MAVPIHESGIKHPRFQMDKAFYEKVRAAKPEYKLVEKIIVPPFSGQGVNVKKGQTFRFVAVDGPQIGDVALWNGHNTKEYFVATRTWVLEGFVIVVGSRLWSDVPFLRPMATCIEDTVINQPTDRPYHHSDARTHCTSEQWEMRTGIAGLDSCHLNFLQAIQPFGLKEENIHDNFMVHQKTHVDSVTGRMNVIRGDSKPGEYIEFYAEMDLLVALSCCPMGDGLRDMVTGEGEAHPLGIEVYETGIQPQEYPKYTDWRPTWTGKWVPPKG